jgi:proteasome alpha subunit
VDTDGTARLFETDPSGTPYEWEAVAIGGNSGEIQGYLEEQYEPGLDADAALELALSALADASDGGLEARGMSAAVVDNDGYRTLAGDELADTIATHGLAADEE